MPLWCNLTTGHSELRGGQKDNCCVRLALAFHISGTALLNRLLAISSSSDDITTKPLRAFTISPRLWEMTASNLLYLKDKRCKVLISHANDSHLDEHHDSLTSVMPLYRAQRRKCLWALASRVKFYFKNFYKIFYKLSQRKNWLTGAQQASTYSFIATLTTQKSEKSFLLIW